jgi:glycerol-3-phosphate dehydrogenase (NAD+)
MRGTVPSRWVFLQLIIGFAAYANAFGLAVIGDHGMGSGTNRRLHADFIKVHRSTTKGFSHCLPWRNTRKSSQLLATTEPPRTPAPPYPVRVTVMGGGNFGLALATVLGRKGVPTTLLVRSADVANHINTEHCHPRYMSDISLPSSIRAVADPESALHDATYIIHAVPCQFSRTFLDSVSDYIPANVPVLSASKGIETSSLGFMADILRDTLGEDRPYAFLSGPSFAREICEGVATAVVIASEDLVLADDLADLMSSDNFRVFTSRDVIGIEIGGAVKNVIALAAGMCEGLGLGTNAMSGLVTRGCAEMRRLGIYFGARPSTIAGLSGESNLRHARSVSFHARYLTPPA